MKKKMPIKDNGKPVWISMANVARLEAFGVFGENYDDLMSKVLDLAESVKESVKEYDI